VGRLKFDFHAVTDEPPLDEDLVEVRHLRVYRFCCEGRLLAHEVGALQRLRLVVVIISHLTPSVRRDEAHLAAPTRRLDEDALTDL